MKMTNTLIWDIKLIHLPKINSNLLSIVSLILLFTMMFLTVGAIASHCEQIKKDLGAAVAAETVAILVLIGARQALKAALVSGNPILIGLAVAGVSLAYGAVGGLGILIANLTLKLNECEKEHGTDNADGHAAGGCVSGGCVV